MNDNAGLAMAHGRGSKKRKDGQVMNYSEKEGKQYLLDAETADRMKGEVGKNVPERHGKTEP